MVDAIAAQFITTYYATFDSNRPGLKQLYRENSVLVFEGTTFTGQAAIGEKFEGLPFQRVQHSLTAHDCTPVGEDSLLIAVFGQLKTDDDPVHSFFQTFLIKQHGDSLFVEKDIFRLILHNLA